MINEQMHDVRNNQAINEYRNKLVSEYLIG